MFCVCTCLKGQEHLHVGKFFNFVTFFHFCKFSLVYDVFIHAWISSGLWNLCNLFVYTVFVFIKRDDKELVFWQ